MIRTSFGIACAIYLAGMMWLLGECQFLIPYRGLLWHEYGTTILLFSAVLVLNLTAALQAVRRWFSLKDTGRRLAHMERQLRHGPTISEELSNRIRDEVEE